MAFSHTFVVPTYNHAAYIGRTLESLLKQDLPGSEIVVSEDHSTDHTMEVLAAFGDRIRIVRPPERKGVAANWNYGVSQARTEWVSLMGADDLALPDFVSAMQAAAERHKGAVLISGHVEQIDGDDTVIAYDPAVTAKAFVRRPNTLYQLAAANVIQVAANCFRRSAWEEVGGFDSRLKIFADWSLWLRLATVGDFAHVGRAIARYRIAYRPGIAKERLPETLSDDADIQRFLIPEVAARMQNIDSERLRRASRRRFRAVVSEAAALLAPHERAFAVALLKDWAHELGAEKMLDGFAAGRPVSPGWRGTAMHRGLRRLYHTLRPA